jgi:pimeloyl-[acyl-carrier protein] synthase
MKLDPAAADRYETLAMFREVEPVHWSDDLGLWIFTRYDDVARALRDPRWRRTPANGTEVSWGTNLPAITSVMNNLFLMMDPPDHTRLRTLVNRAFTPTAAAAMEVRIREIVNEMLDTIEDRPAFDLIVDFAFPLPATVIAEMLGVPTEDLARFKRWSDDFASLLDFAPDDGIAALEQSMVEFAAWIRDLAAARRADSQDDLLTALVERHGGDALTEEELIATVILLIAAGHETTTNLIGSGMLHLLDNPEQLERLRAEPSLAATMVEEILRLEPPVQSTLRIAGEAMTDYGRLIEPGQEVMLSLAGGNRDPAVFEAPDTFDIGRSPNRHLAFGLGPHFCIGSPLARLEGRIALLALFDRFPDLHVDAQASTPSWRPSVVFRGLERLIVER